MSDATVLRRHHLRHIPELKVSDALWRCRYAADCSTSRCSGHCCRKGVLAGIEERDHILSYAELIRRNMDDGQERDVTKWFGSEIDDPDFPSGRAVETQLHKSACVFLDSESRCVLHKAEAGLEPGIAALKPFFCRAFPVCIEYGLLTIDDEHCPGESCCCGPIQEGSLTIFDVYADELAFVVGVEGLRELSLLRESRRLSEDVPRSGASGEQPNCHAATALGMPGYDLSNMPEDKTAKSSALTTASTEVPTSCGKPGSTG